MGRSGHTKTSPQWFLGLLLFLFHVTSYEGEASKILGCPLTAIKSSSLRNDEKLLAILAKQGHEVFILADSGYEPPQFITEAGIKLIVVPRPKGLPVNEHRFPLRNMTTSAMKSVLAMLDIPLKICESFASSSIIHDRLRREKFDMVYYNSLFMCKIVIQGVFGDIPSVEYFAFDTMRRFEDRQLPLPFSYLPINVYHVGQEMMFLERVVNFMITAYSYCFLSKLDYDYRQLARKYKIEPKQPESLALVFGGFPLEYPAPKLPDVVHLNGILAAKPKPLESDIEAFVQSSGDHGLIIMSFGSMITEYDEHNGNLIAEAFARMPQKVLWKYEGPTPKTLGKNTKLVKWFPQTGLLAHHKTKLFITHCGQNSIYETVMFGVPVIALPLFSDQPQNAARLTKSHKIGVHVEFQTMTSDSLASAMTEVISNPMYKENAVRLAKYLNDQPISGKDLFLYWVDYVIRHKGISHLKPYGRFLTWYQYYSLDVLSFLISILFIVCFVLFKCCGYACRKCCSRTKQKRE